MRPQTRESYIAENDSKGMESLLVCSGCRENADRQVQLVYAAHNLLQKQRLGVPIFLHKRKRMIHRCVCMAVYIMNKGYSSTTREDIAFPVTLVFDSVIAQENMTTQNPVYSFSITMYCVIASFLYSDWTN